MLTVLIYTQLSIESLNLNRYLFLCVCLLRKITLCSLEDKSQKLENEMQILTPAREISTYVWKVSKKELTWASQDF